MRERLLAVLAPAAALLAAACAQPATEIQAYALDVAPDTRGYIVSRPDSCSRGCPLVLALHGFGGTAQKQLQHSGLVEGSRRNGYLVVAPDGLGRSWNAGRGPYGACCGEAMKRKVDDVAFLKEVVARVARDYPVDRSRVYVTGWSNGCGMAQRLVAEAGDVFAAAACTGGYLLTMQTSLARPVSVTEIHARDDEMSPYREQDRETGARENAARWAALDRCDKTPSHARVGNASDVETFSGCAGGVQVRLVTLAHSGHDAYANGDGVDVAELVWDSVREARLPTGP